jgi:predicted short-subunit dehydrogenase-like oxidoreductase (DUF2520 family)
MRLTIVGGGRAAWAFGSAWQRAGWIVDQVVLRSESRSRLPELLSVPRGTIASGWSSEAVLVAVPDDGLPEVCASVASSSSERTWLFHPSGSHDSSLFGKRSRVFSLHPLRSLPPPGEGTGLDGALLVFEGDEECRETARTIAERSGARLAHVSRERKPIYHAAAVLASNFVAAQLDLSETLMRQAGLEVDELRDEIVELCGSAALNWQKNAGANRFTGPIARGDVDLVRSHLSHLDEHVDASRLYRAAGLALCRVLLREVPADRDLLEIERLLEGSSLP